MEVVAFALLAVWCLLFIKTAASALLTPKVAGELKEDCWGPVDILVPVRNEADRLLSDFLTDLVRLNHPRGKIFIVDDRSTDESAEIIARVAAASQGRISLLRGVEPPVGWIGKTHALFQGGEAASAPWILLLDSDIRVEPNALSSAMATARLHNASAVCVLPRFVYRSFWVGVVLPAMIWLSIIRVSPLESNSVRFKSVFGFGNFILVDRGAHLAIGGFESYRSDVLDDCALFYRLKSSGHKTLIVDGSDFVESEMYSDLGSLISGFTKNSFAAIGYRFGTLFVALVLIAASVLQLFWVDFWGPISWLFLLPMLATALTIYARLKAPIGFFLLFPAALIVCGWVMVLSSIRTGPGRGALWKGRKVR